MANVLCGHVLASRKSVPWLYVLPIYDILTEVKATISCQDVCLPQKPFHHDGELFMNGSIRSFNSGSDTTLIDGAETRSIMDTETTHRVLPRQQGLRHAISQYQPATMKMTDVFRACLGFMYLEKAGTARLDYSAYEDYCRSTIENLEANALTLLTPSELSGMNNAVLLDILQMIRTGLHKHEIVETLQQRTTCGPNHIRSIAAAVDQIASLLVMVDIGDIFDRAYITTLSPVAPVVWAHGSLRGAINSYFIGHIELSDMDVRLGPTFTAQNLVKLAGLQISWTADLAAHLLLDGEQKRFYIFHHVTFLECQRKRYAPTPPPPSLPCLLWVHI